MTPHRLFHYVLLALLIAIALVMSFPGDASHVKSVKAQGGGGEEPTDKNTAIDFYPDPAASGALPYSLRDPWDHSNLTYFFNNCPAQFDCEEAKESVRDGFEEWVKVSGLTFTEVNSAREADIEVTWAGSDDPEGTLGEFGGVLAYCYFPRYGGDMFIDDAEPWTFGDRGEFDLMLTATHEIGHGIGLGHSEFTSAIMYPYSGYATELGQDDIAAIQELYGAPSGTTPTASNGDDPTTDTPDTTPRDIPENTADVAEVEGTITNTDPFDTWDLTIDEPNTAVSITMSATSDDLDAYIGLLTEDLSTVLAENDDAEEGNSNSSLVYTFAEAGVYKLIATRYGFEDGRTTGNYTLHIEFSEGDGTNNNIPDLPSEIVFRVTNFAETDLCYIYFSPSDADSWGEDQLGEDTKLGNNFYFEWTLEPGNYDVQVWDCFENKLERYSILVERNVDIQIFADSIEIVPLEQVTETPDEETFIWRITNFSDTELCAIYFSPSDADSWGENQVADEPLENDYYIQWDLAEGTYDIRVEDCGEGFLELADVRFRRNLDIQVYNDQILVIPLTVNE